MTSEFQIHNKSLFSVQVCPKYCTGHAYTRQVFVVDLKFTFDWPPVFAFANSGGPVGSEGGLAHVSLPRGIP